MDIQKEIIETIKLMVDKIIDSRNISKDVESVILDISGDLYTVMINGGKFNVPCGVNIPLEIGDWVWVHIPNADVKKAFILSKRVTLKTSDLPTNKEAKRAKQEAEIYPHALVTSEGAGVPENPTNGRVFVSVNGTVGETVGAIENSVQGGIYVSVNGIAREV